MKTILTSIALSVVFLASPLAAQNVNDILHASILTGWRNADGTHTAAIKLDLVDGWKTYWRQPGDVGIPPQFNWSGSQNVSSVNVMWPAPKVTWDDGMRTIGYEDTVVLPLSITAPHSGPIHLNAQVMIGVCAEICIPVDLKFTTPLPAKGKTDRRIHTAINSQPKAAGKTAVCEFKPSPNGMSLTLKLPAAAQMKSQDVAIEINGYDVWIADQTATKIGRDLIATAEVYTANGNPITVPRSNVVTTVFGLAGAMEYRGCTGG